MYHLIDAYLLSAFVAVLGAHIGALLFGAAGVPRAILKALGEEGAAPALRVYWPQYHKLAVGMGTALTLSLVIIMPSETLPSIYSLLLTSLAAAMTLCFYMGLQLIDKINAAKDRADMVAFSRLHRSDVILVGAGLVLGVVLLVAVIYVLPGQFTFWQHGRATMDHASVTTT